MVDIDLINQYEVRNVADAGTIVLNGIPVPAEQVTTSYTSRFESKITLGDYSKDSDQLLSTLVQSNWVGGMLINQHIEGATEQRGRWANAWTMSAEQLALPPYVRTYNNAPAVATTDAKAVNAISTPLIEVDDLLYIAYGLRMWSYETPTEAITDLTEASLLTLPGYAQAPAVFVGGMDRFMVPLGPDGVSIVRSHLHGSPHTIESTNATVKATTLVNWDNKIVAGTTDGYVRVFNTVTGTWDTATAAMRVEADETIRHVKSFYDQSANQAVYIVTDKRLWAYDPEVNKIYPSTVTWPKHATNGHGAAVWRDDAMYISAGVAVTRYTRDGVRSDIGLDRDDGIPPEVMSGPWSGYSRNMGRSITSMAGSQNFLVAAVQLGEIGVAETGDGVNASYPYAICVWNEGGWHVLYEGAVKNDAGTKSALYPDNLMVTESVGGYRVWWGFSAKKRGSGGYASGFVGNPQIQTMGIPRAFHAPRHSVLNAISEFASDGYYEMGWFDAGMRGFQKTWSHLEVTLSDPGTGAPLNGTVEVRYRTDDKPNIWNVLGTISDYGRNILTFGEDETGFPVGVTSAAIDFRFNISSSIRSSSPIIESILLKFIKLPHPGRSWMVSSDISTDQVNGIGPSEMSTILARQTWQGGFSRLLEGGEAYRVRVSQLQHFGGTGFDKHRAIGLNIIEVPIPGHPEWGGE